MKWSTELCLFTYLLFSVGVIWFHWKSCFLYPYPGMLVILLVHKDSLITNFMSLSLALSLQSLALRCGPELRRSQPSGWMPQITKKTWRWTGWCTGHVVYTPRHFAALMRPPAKCMIQWHVSLPAIPRSRWRSIVTAPILHPASFPPSAQHQQPATFTGLRWWSTGPFWFIPQPDVKLRRNLSSRRRLNINVVPSSFPLSSLRWLNTTQSCRKRQCAQLSGGHPILEHVASGSRGYLPSYNSIGALFL